MKLEEINWEDFMPDFVDLYYVDYKDGLEENKDILNMCIEKNEWYPLSEAIFDRWDFPEERYLKDIKSEIESFFDNEGDDDGLIEDCDYEKYYDDHLDEFREWLCDHDESTPMEDLLSNTSDMACYYDLEFDCDNGWNEAFMCKPWQNKEDEDVQTEVAKFLGIDKDTKEWKTLGEICANSNGGRLRIYFNADWDKLIAKEENDYKSVTFNGEFNVGIVNPSEGSGWVDTIKLNKTFEFHRENLSLSRVGDRYCWEEVCGCYDSWCSNDGEPEFSYEECTNKISKAESLVAFKAQEAEYIRVFKAGGCTFGDTNYQRHRDVQYINEVPCGCKCPHCGQFWID